LVISHWLLVIGYLLFVATNAQCPIPYSPFPIPHSPFPIVMSFKILLTSFDIWHTDQKSNSSDDLLAKVSEIKSLPYSLNFLRKLPVDPELAPILAIAQINQLQPDVIICCGMAEGRDKLTVESCACCDRNILKTAVNIEQLVADLPRVEISHDAGKFVCEALYYAVLKHICDSQITAQCIFVHVPILNDENLDQIVADFLLVMCRLIQAKTNIM
jgi:pyroglutamyl-peptidase